MECGGLHGRVFENGRILVVVVDLIYVGFTEVVPTSGRIRNPITLCSVAVLVHVQVWVHIPSDPQCSAEERYKSPVTLKPV